MKTLNKSDNNDKLISFDSMDIPVAVFLNRSSVLIPDKMQYINNSILFVYKEVETVFFLFIGNPVTLRCANTWESSVVIDVAV